MGIYNVYYVRLLLTKNHPKKTNMLVQKNREENPTSDIYTIYCYVELFLVGGVDPIFEKFCWNKPQQFLVRVGEQIFMQRCRVSEL